MPAPTKQKIAHGRPTLKGEELRKAQIAAIGSASQDAVDDIYRALRAFLEASYRIPAGKKIIDAALARQEPEEKAAA